MIICNELELCRKNIFRNIKMFEVMSVNSLYKYVYIPTLICTAALL